MLDVVRESPFNAETPQGALVHALTPAPHVYVRSNFDVPALGDAHVIHVDGSVRHARTIGVDMLRAMPQRTVHATMECAGNDRLGMRPLPVGEPWRHGAVSTMSWTGVPLATLLAECGVDDATREIEVEGADRGPREDATGLVSFARAIPLADAMAPDTLLALAMNGEPLTAAHGAPVRLVVPGWYGMASVKWVTRIAARETPFAGYFQRQRYVYDEAGGVSPVTRMRVKSMIASPVAGNVPSRELVVEGWAWSGDGAITRVEVALDGGERWCDARLGPPTSPHAWTPWSLSLTLPRGGRFTLRSRATDASGAVQPDVVTWNRLGYGNNAVRGIVIEAP